MITVEQTTDESYIKSVFLNPSIYAAMKDDSCPADPGALMAWDVTSIPGFFLRVLKDGVACGSFWLIRKDDGAVEAHTALMDSCRGRDAITATKAAIKWVFDHTDATAIRSYAWSDSPAVMWFCRAVGLKPAERVPWPNMRNGKPVELQWFNLNRQEAV